MLYITVLLTALLNVSLERMDPKYLNWIDTPNGKLDYHLSCNRCCHLLVNWNADWLKITSFCTICIVKNVHVLLMFPSFIILWIFTDSGCLCLDYKGHQEQSESARVGLVPPEREKAPSCRWTAPNRSACLFSSGPSASLIHPVIQVPQPPKYTLYRCVLNCNFALHLRVITLNTNIWCTYFLDSAWHPLSGDITDVCVPHRKTCTSQLRNDRKRQMLLRIRPRIIEFSSVSK